MSASVRIGAQRLSTSELAKLADALGDTLPSSGRFAVHASDRIAFAALMHRGRELGVSILAMPSYWEPERVREVGTHWDAGGRIAWSSERQRLELEPWAHAPPTPAGLVIFTSGTTGVPKAIEHGWDGITASAQFVGERLRGRNWFLSYEPAGYAGLQVFYSALAGGGDLVLPAANASFREHAEAIAADAVEVVSATPTWWRMLVAAWPPGLEVPALEQITLGGEVVDQATLDLVERFFRPAHLTHIYATSEVGSAIVVSDRRAGFPAVLLERSRRAQLRVTDGVLEVRSPYRMQGYLGARRDGSGERGEASDASAPTAPEWIRTGDLIELRDERCYFIGREDRRLNVGGVKVTPEEVESAVLEDPEVRECLVYGKANPITGMLLAADVVPQRREAFDLAAFKQRLKARLPAHQLPKHVRVVEQIQVSASGKKQR